MEAVVKIPEDRIGVIIGENGKVLKELKKKTETKIKVKDNDVIIEGESLKVWKVKDIVKAIARGFSPLRAYKLLNEENYLENL